MQAFFDIFIIRSNYRRTSKASLGGGVSRMADGGQHLLAIAA